MLSVLDEAIEAIRSLMRDPADERTAGYNMACMDAIAAIERLKR